VLNSESLNNVLENKVISRQDIIGIYQNAVEDSGELFSVAQNLRKKFKKDTVTFSKKSILQHNQSMQRYLFILHIQSRARRRKTIFDVKTANIRTVTTCKKIQMC